MIIVLIIAAAIYAIGYVLCMVACRYRISADDRATWPYSLWISLQWPMFAWWALVLVWQMFTEDREKPTRYFDK